MKQLMTHSRENISALKPRPAFVAAALALCRLAAAAPAEDGASSFQNTLGIKFVRIAPGKFQMGNDLPTDGKSLGQSRLFTNGDDDERPLHQVAITKPFYISETEVTVQQFQAFRRDYQDAGRFSPYVTGVSWNEAVAFCAWLSRMDKRNYRLPTEAEWEYVARAASQTLYSTGSLPPKSGEPNAWGVKNMHTDAMEWVLDWYGPYPITSQTDPVGPQTGDSRVVRGGGIMGPFLRSDNGYALYYRRSANRASAGPDYRGLTPIGFRVVEGELPSTPPLPVEVQFTRQFVVQKGNPVTAGPAPRKRWFRQRSMLPSPPEDVPKDAIISAGLNSALNGHNHSAGLAVCPNGDLLMIAFSASSSGTEYLPNTLFVTSRLRFGAEQWDFPDVFYDWADVNDQSALLWNDGGTVRFFGGSVGLNAVPFRVQSSTDNGATWSPIALPLLRGPLSGFAPQPITSAFRSGNRSYVATDGAESDSVLWVSDDERKTWFDAGGRTFGRHTAFVTLKDGRILGLGGKNTEIDGYMPQAISTDGGASWTESKSAFPGVTNNQRPTILRLASGRLFVASDYQNRAGRQPAGIKERGAFVALSDDEGKTWRMKRIPTALPHESHVLPEREGWAKDTIADATLGYTVAAQAPNGVIHLITSMNHPSQHFEMNEAWILSEADGDIPASEIESKQARGEERYGDGKPRGSWSGAVMSDGRFLLNGAQTWSYPNGGKQYEVTYKHGNKVGVETYWSADGKKVWEWRHDPDGTSTWVHYWPNGNRKHQSEWQKGMCSGVAMSWSPDGAVEKKFEFLNGDLKR